MAAIIAANNVSRDIDFMPASRMMGACDPGTLITSQRNLLPSQRSLLARKMTSRFISHVFGTSSTSSQNKAALNIDGFTNSSGKSTTGKSMDQSASSVCSARSLNKELNLPALNVCVSSPADDNHSCLSLLSDFTSFASLAAPMFSSQNGSNMPVDEEGPATEEPTRCRSKSMNPRESFAKSKYRRKADPLPMSVFA